MTDDRKDGERKVPSWQLPEKRQPETDAYHIWTPRPLLRSIYWKPDPPPPPDIVSSTYEVFIDQRAWLTMHEHVWQTPAEKTPFGYLVGDLCEDPNASRRFINITAALPARFAFREEKREQISREATLALQLEVERRRGVLAGWYHRHLGGAVAMSESDVSTHHKHFTEPWQCAFVFVAREEGCEGGCFRSSPEEFAGDLHLPFYEMASNESLLARGVKRSYVDWGNYTTVDEIRSEPPPRPPLEIPPEPEEDEVDEDLHLEPFDADPDALEAAQTAEAEPTEAEPTEAEPAEAEPAEAEPAEAEPEEKVPEEPEADVVESETLASGIPESDGPESDEMESDEPEADDRVGEAEAEAEAKEERVDLDAAIEEVRPARIELDADAESEDAATIDDATPSEEARESEEPAEAGREGDIESAAPVADPETELSTLDSAEPDREGEPAAAARAKPERPPAPSAERPPKSRPWKIDRSQLVPIVIGVLLLAAVAAGFFWLSGDDASTAGGRENPATTQPAAGGQAEDGPGEATGAADSVQRAGVTAAQVDSAGQEMLQAISRFYGRAVARDRDEATCEELAAAYVTVEDAWIRYNTEFKAEFAGALPDRLAERDERLYDGVQDAEREFELSGCPRP